MKLTLLLALAAGWMPSAAAACGALSVSGAYVPEPPPMARTAAAYFAVHNGSTHPARIVRAEGACADAIEIHRTTLEDNVARMMPVPELTIAPGETLTLAPGGLHVMLHGAALAPGETCRFALVLADGSELPVTAPVRPRGARPAADHAHARPVDPPHAHSRGDHPRGDHP